MRCRSRTRCCTSGSGGAAEHAIDEFAHHLAEHALTRPRGTIDERAIGTADLHVPLPLEDAHHRHHGRVRDLALRARSVSYTSRTVTLSRSQTIFMISSSCSVRTGGCFAIVY